MRTVTLLTTASNTDDGSTDHSVLTLDVIGYDCKRCLGCKRAHEQLKHRGPIRTFGKSCLLAQGMTASTDRTLGTATKFTGGAVGDEFAMIREQKFRNGIRSEMLAYSARPAILIDRLNPSGTNH